MPYAFEEDVKDVQQPETQGARYVFEDDLPKEQAAQTQYVFEDELPGAATTGDGAVAPPGTPAPEAMAMPDEYGSGGEVPTDPTIKVTSNAVRGLGASFAQGVNTAAGQFAKGLDEIATYISDKTGLPKGGLFENAAKEYQQNTDYWDKAIQETGADALTQLMGKAAGGAVPGIAEFSLGPAYYGLKSAVEAENRGESPIVGAVTGAGERYVTGKVLDALNTLKMGYRVPGMAAVGAAQAAVEGGDIPENAGTMALYGAFGPPGGIGARDIVANLKRMPIPRTLDEYIAQRSRPAQATQPPVSPAVEPRPTGRSEVVQGQAEPVAQAGGLNIEETGVPQGTLQPSVPSPLDIAREHVLKGNEQEGLSPEAVGRIAQNIAYDAGMPGFFRKEYIRPYAENAVKYAQESGEEVSRTHLDIGNLTGINNAKGHEAANQDIKEIADIIKQSFEEVIPAEKLDFGREGGDEMSVYGRGVSKTDLDRAAQTAKIRVEQYAKDNGLLQLPSKRGVPEDVSLHTNTENINEFFRNNPKAATEDFLIFNDAKRVRKGAEDELRSRTETPRTVAPEGQAGSSAEGITGDNRQVQPETSATANPAKVTPQPATAAPIPKGLTEIPKAEAAPIASAIRTATEVEKALFQGKPVSQEELNTYPKLAKRYGKAVLKTRTPLKVYHFTKEENINKILSEGFNADLPPLHGTGGLEAGAKMGKFGKGVLYFTTDKDRWSIAVVHVGEGKGNVSRDVYNYDKQKWEKEVNAYKKISLKPIEATVKEDANILEVNSWKAAEGKWNDKYDFIGNLIDYAKGKGYDILHLSDPGGKAWHRPDKMTTKYGEESWYKLLTGGSGKSDYFILNKDVLEIESPKQAAVPREQTVTGPSEKAAPAKSQGEEPFVFKDDFGSNVNIKVKNDTANIYGMYAEKRGTKLYERVIDKLRKQDIKTINVELQSADSQAALKDLVDRGILINPRNKETYRPDSGYYRTFDIAEKPGGKTEPTAKPDTARTSKTQFAFSPGSKYEGMRQGGQAMPEGTEKEPVLRREPIIKNLMSDLEAALYEGRVKNKKAGGFYRQQIEEVRSRKKSDLETIGHEVAHMLDDRMPELKSAYRQYKDELKAVSYDKKSVSEGFAEFVRLWLTNKTVAAERVPQFNAWFNEFVKTSKYGKALIEAQTGMHKWFEQGEVKKLASKIGEQAPINEVLDGMGDRFRQSISDDLHGVYKMEREQTGKISPVGAYETARLTRAAYAITDGTIQYGYPVVLPNGDHTFHGKGLKDILKSVAKDLDSWTYYAVARSANELFRQGRENLFTPSEIQAGLALETPEFRQAFDAYQVWNKGILDFAEAKGLISPASRALWRRMEYLPFRREGQWGAGRKAKGVEGNWNGIRMLTGGTGNVRDVLLNMTSNAANLISESLKNEARVKIADLADKTKGGARFMAKIPKDTLPVSVDKQQIKAFVYQALGINPKAVEMGNVPEEAIKYIAEIEKNLAEHPEFIQFWQMGQAPKGENIVAVLRSGEPDFYEVADPVLYRAIASLNRPAKNWMVRFLGAIRQVGQQSITLSVDFMTANIARDTISGAIMTRSGFRPFVDSIRGMKSRISKDQDYRDFIANGGGLASYMLDEGKLRKHLEKFYSKKGLDTRTILDTPAKAFYFLENITDAFEVSTRIGEFKRAREKGESARHAAYQAREVSTDFAMRGDSQVAGFFYDTVMFLRAGVNGMDRLYRGFAHDPNRGNIAMKAGTLALISAALYMLNKDNDDYKDLPDWDKDNYWHFFFKGQHFRYPKIWEIGAMASVSERTMEQLFDHDASWKKYPQDVFRITTNLFKINVIPQALSPVYEQATNKRGFSGTPIEQQWMEDLQPWARSHPQGNRTLRGFGEAERNWPRNLQISPARVEALLQGYFNTWATYGLMLSDAAFYDDVPELRIDDYPGFRRFYAATPAKHTKYEVMYWDMLREATELRRTMRLMDKYPGSQKFADEIEARHASELEDYAQLENLKELLQDNRIGMTEVIKDRKMNPKEKRVALDKLVEEKNKMLKDVMTEISERKNKEKK